MSIFQKTGALINRIRHSYRSISRIGMVYWANRIVFLAMFIAGIIIVWLYKRLPPQIPIWYCLPWGADRLAEPYYLFTPLLFSGLAHQLNLIISITLLRPYTTFIRMLMISSIFVSILSLLIIINVLNLVF